MQFNMKRALELLREGTQNPGATFHRDQDSAIGHVVNGNGPLLLVQRTGWGKSNVYFIATKMLREQGAGPTLLISPLLVLMRNQIEAASRLGVRAETINSSNTEEWMAVIDRILQDEVDILLISPERLGNQEFINTVLKQISSRIMLLVVDEAHCISDWGHDFRPDYRRIERMLSLFPQNLRILATTATANRRVMDDLKEVLGPDLLVLSGDLNRPSLTLQTIWLPNITQRMAMLATQLPKMSGSGIIYTLTKRDAERLTAWLNNQGLNVAAYTSDKSDEERLLLEGLLSSNSVKALVATIALGMGYDKPDLGFVIHYQTPGSVVSYYQQVGRAGRDGKSAYGILLSGREDREINEFFIKSAFPSQEEVQQVVEALDIRPDGLTISGLEEIVNMNRKRLNQTLKILALESPAPIVKQGSRWQLTPTLIHASFWDRVERLTAIRQAEQEQMQEYVSLIEGHMEFLIEALDGDPRTVTPSRLPPVVTQEDPLLIQEAELFLRSGGLPITPRKQWPFAMEFNGFKRSIPDLLRANQGRALCYWGDDGWAQTVNIGKYSKGRYVDDLVQACAELVYSWAPSPLPEWVTCIPSRRHPELVPDFAFRLAERLELPFVEALQKVRDHQPQKEMVNSAHQCRNLIDTMRVVPKNLLPGPILLVDDMVDSRWTFTFSAWLLRKAGSAEVWPMALAHAGAGG